MLGGQEVQLPAKLIAVQRLNATVAEPEMVGRTIADHIQHHFLMIPLQSDQVCMAAQFNECIDDAARIWSAIDIVTQGHNGVAGTSRDLIQHRVKRRPTAVNVSDRN